MVTSDFSTGRPVRSSTKCPGAAAAQVAPVRARVRAGLAPQRAQQPPADRGRRDARPRDLRGPLGVRQRDELLDAGRAGELQQGDVVPGSGGVLVPPVHPNGLDVDPPPPFLEVVGAGQDLDIVRGEVLHTMRGGEHPPLMDNRAPAELHEAGPPRVDQGHLPRPRPGLGLHAADDPRVALRSGAAGRLVRRRRPHPAGQQHPDRQTADHGGREGRCFDALHGFDYLLGLVLACRPSGCADHPCSFNARRKNDQGRIAPWTPEVRG